MVEWASTGLDKSAHQPVLPSAIIILNKLANVSASQDDLFSHYKDIGYVTMTWLEQNRDVHKNSPKLKEYTEFWKLKGKSDIKTMKELLEIYYSNISVVVVPFISGSQPETFLDQIQKLYDEIYNNQQSAITKRLAVRMRFNSSEFEHNVQLALDHFSGHLDVPFDFAMAALKDRPISPNFSEHITRVIIKWTERYPDMSIHAVLLRISPLVASCIIFNASHSGHRGRYGCLCFQKYLLTIIGSDDQIFEIYSGDCTKAYENFYDRFWPCQYRSNSMKCGIKGDKYKPFPVNIY
jgi:hypothetical protein